ncbi:nitrilase-related carbon-nitrogen hydrolase [Streptomyces sp. NPDC001508]|uniref:nitrilase-related carbon-nitrogen hydrolase n=1 Tax=Streptomyces sp. NPDC001508 TaxID=3154656 RepID=UPI0033303AC1
MVVLASAAVEFTPLRDFTDFAAHMRAVLDRTPDAAVVVLPEYVGLELLTLEAGWESMTIEDIVRTSRRTDDYVNLFIDEARARQQYILAGTQLVETATGWLNTAHLFGPEEGLILTHAKTHLFPAEGHLGTIHTSDTPPPVTELPFGPVGINICYEAQIPECADAVIAQGAEILLVPSLTLSEAGSWRVNHCAQSRAIENQMFVVSSQLFGAPQGFFPGCYARSAVYAPCDAPWPAHGELASTSPNTEESVKAEVSLSDLARVRAEGATLTWADRADRAPTYAGWPSRRV